MKEIALILFMCSATENVCMPAYVWPDSFDDDYSCMIAGYEESINKMKEIKGIRDVHHVHIWAVHEKFISLEAHIVVDHMTLEEIEAIKAETKLLLKKEEVPLELFLA